MMYVRTYVYFLLYACYIAAFLSIKYARMLLFDDRTKPNAKQN